MIHPEEVIDVICDYYQLDRDVLCNKRENGKHYRGKEYVNGRQVYYYWCHKNTLMTLNQMRQRIDMQDHSTAIYGIDQVKDRYVLYPKFKKQLEEIYELIRQKEVNLLPIIEELCPEPLLND